MIEAMGQVHDQLQAIAARSRRVMPTYLREDEEHRRVAEAVASGDAGGAADLFREHIVGFEEQFVRAFGHRSAEEEMGD
jgi:DNA-binding GntR family transcriptional regulator